MRPRRAPPLLAALASALRPFARVLARWPLSERLAPGRRSPQIKLTIGETRASFQYFDHMGPLLAYVKNSGAVAVRFCAIPQIKHAPMVRSSHSRRSGNSWRPRSGW